MRWTVVLLMYSASLALATASAASQERETVLDRVAHVQDDFRTIPPAHRLEAGLDLTVRRVRVGDAELHVEEEGRGVPMVLINGGPGGTHHYFHPWFGRARDYARVIYYDQRGTGLSDFVPGKDGYSVEQAVADLEAMRNALGVDRWVLVGYSYGGFLAQYYTTSHAEHVAGLVLVGASPGMWTDFGESRQWDYIAEEEAQAMRRIAARLREVRAERGWSPEEYLRLRIYNNWINGDWKRQNFFKPSAERFAQVALYEWVNDGDFNGVMSGSADKVDLTGAFDASPIPTLLLEGKWDLTWGDQKATILSRNHPQARMVVIPRAGHGAFGENPDVFFGELAAFVGGLRPVASAALTAYRRHLENWRTAWQGSPRYIVRVAGYGSAGSRRITEAYAPTWLETMPWIPELRRIGFAHYDVERYEVALAAFVRMEEVATSDADASALASALIWQGHVLDLLGRRTEAVARYQRVMGMNIDASVRHDQYGLAFSYGAYAAERVQTPFERIENAIP